MNRIWEFLLLILSINLDCFATSVTEGLILKCITLRKYLKIGVAFGLTQSLLFLIGYFGGQTARTLIAPFDHWVAFGLLLAVGIHMILEQFDEEKKVYGFSGSYKTLFAVSVAVSIDALAIGVVTSIISGSVGIFAIFVFLLTFLISVAGIFVGAKFSLFSEKFKYTKAIGGVILILLGTKILLEHLGVI